MRVAPIGLFASAISDDDRVFGIAADAAALTHGHPGGLLSAGHLATAIAALLRGDALPAALDAADTQLRTHERHSEVADALAAARTSLPEASRALMRWIACTNRFLP